MTFYTIDLNGNKYWVRDRVNPNPDGPHRDLYIGECPFHFGLLSNVLETIVVWNVRLHMEVFGDNFNDYNNTRFER